MASPCVHSITFEAVVWFGTVGNCNCSGQCVWHGRRSAHHSWRLACGRSVRVFFTALQTKGEDQCRREAACARYRNAKMPRAATRDRWFYQVGLHVVISFRRGDGKTKGNRRRIYRKTSTTTQQQNRAMTAFTHQSERGTAEGILGWLRRARSRLAGTTVMGIRVSCARCAGRGWPRAGLCDTLWPRALLRGCCRSQGGG